MPNTEVYQQQNEAKECVIKSEARIEKKTTKRKILDFLFSDKLDSIGSYLLNNIIGPSLKALAYDIGNNTLQMALFGRNTVGGRGGDYIPGQGYRPAQSNGYMYQQVSQPGYAQPQPFAAQQRRVGINDISYATKDDAWMVIDRMGRDISRYGKVTAADYYTYSGVTGEEDNWVLRNIGWYTLGGAQPILRTDGRWMISFPPTQQLN